MVTASSIFRLSPTNTSRTCSTSSGPAFSGLPQSNGGAGSYSRPSWVKRALGSPSSSARTVSPKSMPAVTPPPVIRLRSTTTRSGTTCAPSGASSSRNAQCVPARWPSSRPAPPSTSDPVHTEVT